VTALFDNAVVEVLTLVLVGLVLWAVLRGIGWTLRVLPVSQARADLTERVWPAVVAFGVVVYALFAARLLLGDAPGVAPLAGAVVLGMFVALSWFVLRDTVSGVFLRAGRACRVGDFVHIGDVEGRVERMGWRAMVVVTSSGKEAIIPYSRAVQSSIVRTPERAQASPHPFTVKVDGDLSDIKEAVRRAALLCHWSSVVREPEVSLEGEDSLAVIVYALDAERGYEIEAAVRDALKARATARPRHTMPAFGASKRPSRPPPKPGAPAE
jgi:small-conductance mechanosensitive channel